MEDSRDQVNEARSNEDGAETVLKQLVDNYGPLIHNARERPRP